MLLLIIILILSIWRFWEWRKLKKVIEVSKHVKCGYTAYPLIGHGHMFFGDGFRRMKAFVAFGRKAIEHGFTNLWLGRNYLLVVADAVEIEKLSKFCLEKDDLMRFPRKLIGNGTIFAPVSIWRPRRKFLIPTFRSKNLAGFVKIFSKNSSLLVDQLERMAGKGSFPMWSYISSYAMDSVCETTLGVEVGALTQKDSPLLKSFCIICQLVAQRIVSPWLHSDWVYKMLPYHNSFYRNKKILCDFVDEVIKSKTGSSRSENLKSVDMKKEPAENEIKTFLELLIEPSGKENKYSDIELREEVLILLLGGTDTSAVGISFITLILSRHQDVQRKVYQELQEVFGDSNRRIESEDLPRLKYLEAVIKETLRLYPPVPVIARKVETNVTLSSGVNLVPGCGVLLHIWAVQRNPRYWGADAEEFRPERFLDSPTYHPMAFMAFSSGPRNCIGYQYAMMSMKTVISSLIRRYRLLPGNNCPRADDSDLRLTFDVTMKDADQFAVRLEKRL